MAITIRVSASTDFLGSDATEDYIERFKEILEERLLIVYPGMRVEFTESHRMIEVEGIHHDPTLDSIVMEVEDMYEYAATNA